MEKQLDWDIVPDHIMEAYQKRLALVETLLDDAVDELHKKQIQAEYCQTHSLSERTIRNYLLSYKRKGAESLLLYHPALTIPRIQDPQLRDKLLTLIMERPTRTVRQLRALLSANEEYREKISLVSDRTIYRFLYEAGFTKKARYALLSADSRLAYHRFQAPHSLALVQGDARDGIWINAPDSKRWKTYLFVWLDDYVDEKLPRMEDSFKKMVLRWGIANKYYVDNGSVYSARHFAWILKELGSQKIHHPPYQAYCKGKVEAIQKTIKLEFQAEAEKAGFATLEELNTALWAWIETVYNVRVHSTTGEPPNKRFKEALPATLQRVKDISYFEALFLLRDTRTVTKYGQIKLFANQYPVKNIMHGTVVEVRYNPFDLRKIYIYQAKKLIQTIESSKITTYTAPALPEERKNQDSSISEASRNYFTRLREEYKHSLMENGEYIAYAKLKTNEEEKSHA
jgi:hypothetical protein